MRVLFKNFIITSSYGFNVFDVAKAQEVKDGKTKGQIQEINVAYGVTLKRAFAIILDGVVEADLKDVELTLREYLIQYDECNESLKKEIQRFEASLNKS
tara:strand:+ start:512 stop:808 length:297 start_codon:yes stop_codon:yes gene_type:complete